MSMLEKSQQLVNVLKKNISSADFVLGFDSEYVSRENVRPVVAVWADTYSEERGSAEMKILFSMCLGQCAYESGIQIYEDIFAILRSQFPSLKTIKRNSPKIDGQRLFINCSADVTVNISSALMLDEETIQADHVTLSYSVRESLYTEVFEDVPTQLCVEKEGYKISLVNPSCTAEKLMNCKTISLGAYTYTNCTLTKIEVKDGFAALAEYACVQAKGRTQ